MKVSIDTFDTNEGKRKTKPTNCITPAIKSEAEQLVKCVIEEKILVGRIEALKARLCHVVRKEIHISGTTVKWKAGKFFPVLSKEKFERILRDRNVLPEDMLNKIITEASVSRQIPGRTEVHLGRTHKNEISAKLQEYGIATVHGNEDAVAVPTKEK